ncbi:DMT family transporter [Halioglobus maricola]|nr:DMT family transporter [Halioglobus maricola]
MMLALFCFCMLAVASRELTRDMGTVQILFWRSLLGVTMMSVLLYSRGHLNRTGLRPELAPWHLLRNGAHFAGQCAWLLAIAALPLAEVFALEFTTPFWAALLAAIFMGEAMNRGRWASVVLGLVGVLVILRPGTAAINPASLIMLAGAVGFGISVIVTRKLTLLLYGTRHAFMLVLWYMTAMQCLFALVLLLPSPGLPPADAWPWMVAAAVAALVAHYCLTRALSYADAAIVMPIDYLRLPLIMVTAWLLYDEAVTVWLVAGSALIVCGNAMGLYMETVRKRSASTAPGERLR